MMPNLRAVKLLKRSKRKDAYDPETIIASRPLPSHAASEVLRVSA